MVTFTACPFTADYPEQREGQPPTSRIKIDNVNREFVPKIRAALGVREYIQILYREYLGTDLTEPAYGPIEFELRDGRDNDSSYLFSGSVYLKNEDALRNQSSGLTLPAFAHLKKRMRAGYANPRQRAARRLLREHSRAVANVHRWNQDHDAT
jgi:hypothetical protein